MKLFLVLATTLLLSGCAHQANEKCGTSPIEIPSAVASKNVLVLGEVHGSAEAPAFIGDLACQFLARGERLNIGLEIPNDEQMRIALYLTSAGKDVDKRALIASPHWQRINGLHDGRTSIAMLDLIERARMLNTNGHNVHVYAIDAVWNDLAPNETRDQVMAKNVRNVVKNDSARKTLILVGNAHSRKSSASWQEEAPMSSLFGELKTVSFNVSYVGGEAWQCRPVSGATKCGVGELGSCRKSSAEPRKMYFSQDAADESHDGFFTLGCITASLPAATLFAK